MADKKTIRSLQQVRNLFEREIKDFLGDPKKVAGVVHDIIYEATEKIVCSTMGLEHRWNDWSLRPDHSKQYPLHDQIKQVATKAAKEYIKKAGDFTTLSKKDQRHLARVFHDAYVDELASRLYAEAEAKAAQDTKKIVKLLAKEPVPYGALLKEIEVGAGIGSEEDPR